MDISLEGSQQTLGHLGEFIDSNDYTIILQLIPNGIQINSCLFYFHSFNSPNFVGTENSFLFTLRPRMRSFSATTYNNHYQYLNLHQQTMPNGKHNNILKILIN
jgi:hypothetical protein